MEEDKSMEVRVPTWTDWLPACTNADGVCCWQFGIEVQESPLSAYGEHTEHTALLVIAGPRSVVMGVITVLGVTAPELPRDLKSMTS